MSCSYPFNIRTYIVNKFQFYTFRAELNLQACTLWKLEYVEKLDHWRISFLYLISEEIKGVKAANKKEKLWKNFI